MNIKSTLRTKAMQFLNLDSFIEELVQSKIKEVKKQLSKTYTAFQHSGDLVTVVGAEYTILQVEQPCKFWGFIDLSDCRPGDKVEIKVLYKSQDGKYKHYFYKELEGPFPNPIFSFDERNTPGMEVRIRQTAGFPARHLLYNWGWINL